MSTKTIEIAKDFSEFPAGRYLDDGPFPGEKFRDEILVPTLESNDTVEVLLDGTEGYGSSFLEEAFGGLIRNKGFTESDLKKRLIITSKSSDFDTYVAEAWEHIHAAESKRLK